MKLLTKVFRNKQNIIVIGIFIFAILIRLINWPLGISDLNCDEAMIAINANSIAKTRKRYIWN